jgi:imidazolonepropionase
MTTRVLSNIGELTTNDPSLGDESDLGRLYDAAMVVDETHVLWIGRDVDAPAADERFDLQGAAVVPGFVDSHTHLVFGGERSLEFEARMAGTPYDGGGIRDTVEATRRSSRDELREATARRARALQASGVTTMEIKSGYELTTDGEVRLLEIANEFSDEVTYLGGHVVPDEFLNDRDGYVDLVAGSMLAACAPHARWADVFCDVGAFSVDEARAILLAASDPCERRGRASPGVLQHRGDAVAGRGVLHAQSLPLRSTFPRRRRHHRARHGLQSGHFLRDQHALCHSAGRSRDGPQRRRGPAWRNPGWGRGPAPR